MFAASPPAEQSVYSAAVADCGKQQEDSRSLVGPAEHGPIPHIAGESRWVEIAARRSFKRAREESGGLRSRRRGLF